MNELIAKPIVKNKFWVVEDQGQKVATIQAVEDGTIVYVHNEQREKYPSIKLLTKHHNIKFDKLKNTKTVQISNHVYGFPIDSKSYNEIFDVQRRLPIYTKTEKSKSQYCAGYYLIKFNDTWNQVYCPKRITVTRYQFNGPYKSQQESQIKLKELNEKLESSN